MNEIGLDFFPVEKQNRLIDCSDIDLESMTMVKAKKSGERTFFGEEIKEQIMEENKDLDVPRRDIESEE